MTSTSSPDLTRDERLDILKIEMTLLQGRFDKYDDLIFRNRAWTGAILVALVGAAVSVPKPHLLWLAFGIPFVFYIIEGMWRYQYWYKYVFRYRFLRDSLKEGTRIEEIALYDLTHHYGVRPAFKERFRQCFIRSEPAVFYGLLVGAVVAAMLFTSPEQLG